MRSPAQEWPKEKNCTGVFINSGTPKWIPIYYDPEYEDSQKGGPPYIDSFTFMKPKARGGNKEATPEPNRFNHGPGLRLEALGSIQTQAFKYITVRFLLVRKLNGSVLMFPRVPDEAPSYSCSSRVSLPPLLP